MSTRRSDLRMTAEATELSRARRFVREAATGFGLHERATYEFVYAVNEAMTNAIKHGSTEHDGRIGVAIETDGDTLVCAVSDGGPFVPPTAYAGANLAESGRGFAFMSALTDELKLSVAANATVVRLCKRRVVSDGA
ncbi:MAG TPA: ATP-binding protein [Solirubrobacteraceae bacterium]|nr:ATP-binding protein [Solirubrobacteraceae bacterium]